MNQKLKITLIAAALLGVASPTVAGSPDSPGEQGEIVNDSKQYWQDKTGAKNAFGQTVSGVAKGENPKEDRKLGVYLNFMAGGPNPFSDNGKGND